MKDYICIFTAVLARYCLKNGCKLHDIKPNKETLDKTVFIFENTEQLQKTLENYK